MKLEDMYKEYFSLKQKLEGLKSLIILYGGTVPDSEDIDNEPSEGKGTWKERIIFILTDIMKPATTKDIESYIIEEEGSISEKAKKAISLYTSRMAREGEIGVDNTHRPHKYFIKPTE